MELRICVRAASPCWRPISRRSPLTSITGSSIAPTPLKSARSIHYSPPMPIAANATTSSRRRAEPNASLDERIAATQPTLSPAEERVASFFAQHREEAVFLSAADIARQLDTSDATVIRAVQSLGYSGLPALKSELQEALRSRATPTLRLGRSIEDHGDDPTVVLEHVLATEMPLERARDLKLPSILITDTLGLALAGQFTVALSARRAGGGMFHLSAMTVVVLDALLFGLAGQDRVAALAAADELQELRARIDKRALGRVE